MSGLMTLGIKLGNDRFAQLLERLGNPHRDFNVAHVAGTNGKGSTTAMIASIMRAAGYRVGAYYSPYVFDLRERILIDGLPVPQQAFAEAITFIRPHVEALAETEFGWTTEFELKTAAAFHLFAREKVEFAAVEVGMGGRLDATNVVSPAVCVLTNIGLDHTEYLGSTLESIAFEKAGIIKPGVPVVTAATQPEALSVIQSVAKERSTPLTVVRTGEDRPYPSGPRWRRLGQAVEVRCDDSVYHLNHPRLPGAYQAPNIACAVIAARRLRDDRFDIPDDVIVSGIADAWLPGRMQVVCESPTILLDGAHNAEAARALADTLAASEHNDRKRTLILGMTRNHDPEGVIAALGPGSDRIIVTRSSNSRARAASALLQEVYRQGLQGEVASNVPEALRIALVSAAPEGLILVTGSFFTIGDVPLDEFGG